MLLTADFHIHSHFSRATSRAMTPEKLFEWGQLKGINVLGTGDFTHPAWFAELREKLEEAEPGLFRLKEVISQKILSSIPSQCRTTFRFILSAEISTIYSKNNAVRKVHHVITAPSFEAVSRIQEKLSRIGNLASDGRPILGLDSKELLKIVLDASPENMYIPAHIWTPHFSVFGSKSGFDSLEACYEELSPHIAALETGLSSDPAMNWRWSALDRLSLVSNSDAHSPEKIGREANRFDTELSYSAIRKAVISADSSTFLETLEFYPEEGKYHFDGHRACGVCFSPQETEKHHGLCPQCGRPVIIGVMNRVSHLADRPEGFKPTNRVPFRSLIPLAEILADILGTGVKSKKVVAEYFALLSRLGSEFSILLDIPIADIRASSSDIVAEAISRVRNGAVSISPGYDGEYGKISVFPDKATRPEPVVSQMKLF